MRAVRLSLIIPILLCAGVCADMLPPEASFPFPLNLTRIMPGNLLTNPDFEEDAATLTGWTFGNFAGTSDVGSGICQDAQSGARSALAFAKGSFPAYWVQTVKVEEGVRYYASVHIKADLSEGTMGLRLATDQYNDEAPGVSWTTNNSNTIIQEYAECDQGKSLEDFIDPANLRIIGRNEWHLYQMEFVVPVGKKVDTYAYWAGMYGIGTALVDNAYFGKAAFEINGSLMGTGLKRLRIVDSAGNAFLDQPLNGNETEHGFKVDIPSRLTRWQIEVTDANNKLWRRSL